ncbi:esterase [Nesidiocoris tenuis]|uniref:Carboxylic ester hydrolase n=1 Tax=Nesidiocoris tenuis TaxID=355587 RepID=A0ABN7AT87_9HEMI|nr:esterase [Nesidiocoris tenuis]
MLVILVGYWLLAIAHGARPIARTEYGPVEGIEMETYGRRKIYGFFNIPYTEDVNSRRRFEELKDPAPWYDVFDAGGPPKDCPYVTISNDLTGVENCLGINIFSPLPPNPPYSARLYPVVVYIHGGAYYFYSGGDFGPRYLLDKDVVLVTINFRIGIPGFGSTGDYILPGNLGLKDQVKALKWIQRNIRNFGGDKNLVTLVGMSSGASCVHLHYISPQSRGLFHRGFMSGGAATEFWSMSPAPLRTLELVAKNLKCPTDTPFDIVVCLERVPARELAMSVRTVQVGIVPIAPFAPVLDEFSRDPFLTEYPYEALRAGHAANLPLVVSDVLTGGIFPGAPIVEDEDAMRLIDQNWNYAGDLLLGLKDNILDVYLNDTLRLIRQFYFGDSPINRFVENPFIKMISDRYFLANAMKAVALQARHNPQVYFYLFDYKGGQSTAQALSQTPNKYNASHIDDMLYFFNATQVRSLEQNSTDLRMIDRMTTMLANFARTGVPYFGGNVDFRPVSQQTSIFGPINLLRIRSPDDMKMEEFKNLGNIKFWESLPFLSPRKTTYYRSNMKEKFP